MLNHIVDFIRAGAMGRPKCRASAGLRVEGFILARFFAYFFIDEKSKSLAARATMESLEMIAMLVSADKTTSLSFTNEGGDCHVVPSVTPCLLQEALNDGPFYIPSF